MVMYHAPILTKRCYATKLAEDELEILPKKKPQIVFPAFYF